MIEDRPGPAASISSRAMFQGGGEIGRLLSELDWSTTALGPPESWPQSLRSIVRMMLTSRYQMWMAWGPELVYLYNDAYRPTLGVKHPWSLAKPVPVVWKEIWGDIGPLMEQVLATGEAIYSEGLLLLLERSGFPEETYHTFSYSPLFDDDGSIAGMFCVVVEETDRVLNERRLATLRELATGATGAKTESELFNEVVERLAPNLRDLPFTLSYLFDAEGGTARLVAATGIDQGHPAAPTVLDLATSHWPVEALNGNSPPIVVQDLQALYGDMPTGAWDRPPLDALLVPIAQQAHDRAAAGFMVVGLNPYRRGDENLRGFIGLVAGQIASALSTVRAYEEERKRAEALAEIDKAKTTFFSNVSHEFRTPLTLMLGPLEEVLADGADPAATRSQVELAHRNGVRLLRLVNSLLDFSRIEAGRVQASYEPTDLAQFSAEIASSFRSAMEKAGLTLSIDAEPLPQLVYLDREMWEKVLLNLLSNAFKFTFEGEVAVSVRRAADGRGAVVEVRDSGIGIPEAELPKLFERFHRVIGAQGRSFEGSGIGLALVHELVKLHGGEITARSEVGRGTTFSVTLPFGIGHLPQDQVRDAGGATPARAQPYLQDALRWLPADDAGADLPSVGAALGVPAQDLPGTGKRLILADDNADMRDYVRRLLVGQGYEVEAVADGEQAMAAARAQAPDLLLSDVMMPKLDGFGVLRAIREDPQLAGTPVVLLSARAGEEAKVEGLEAGADDYLVKPFAARELLARVGANIQMAKVRREAARAIMASEQRFLMTRERLQLALSTGRVAVWEWDTSSDIAIVHGPLVELFGVEPQEAAHGVPLAEFLGGIHPDDLERVQTAIQTAVDTDSFYEAEYRIVGGARPRVVVARGSSETTPEGGRRLTGALIDITEEKAAEAELQSMNANLEARVAAAVEERNRAEDALRQAQKMEAVGQLTGGVAHDFNNLLTVIIGGLDTIKRVGATDEARLRRSADMALQGAQRAASLTGRLLAFSRRQPLAPKATDLNQLVQNMSELLHRTLGETIELESVLASRLWTIEVDQNQLESAVLNLAVNARDAMPDGGKLTIETANTALDESYTATDREVIPGQYVMVAVSDSGSGMSAETLARVFEPFFTTKEVGRGTGLGLSMVYGFVKQSGGHVTVYSEEGHGTTVKMYFPRFRGAADVAEAVVVDDIPRGSREEVVLVVEDNAEVRNYSVMVLNELGYQVLEAEEAEAGLAILSSNQRIDLLFTDVVLPGKSGRVLADAARALRPNLRVLFTTGYSRNAIVHHGRLDPGVQLITKPFTFEQLATRVRDMLDRAPTQATT